MREILFRGKRLDNGEWVEGCLLSFETLAGTKAYIIPLEQMCTWLRKSLTHVCEVDPKTVGQFTGLLDITGKRIFEGDIMRNAGNVVEFCSDGFCINGDSPLAFWTKTKIIGNIHDKEGQS